MTLRLRVRDNNGEARVLVDLGSREPLYVRPSVSAWTTGVWDLGSGFGLETVTAISTHIFVVAKTKQDDWQHYLAVTSR